MSIEGWVLPRGFLSFQPFGSCASKNGKTALSQGVFHCHCFPDVVCGVPRPTRAGQGTTTNSGCWIPTYAGTAGKSVCVFPFTYKGVSYTGCSTVDNDGYPWCYTSYNYANDHLWGICQGTICIII